MFCISLVIFFAGSLLIPATIGRMIVTVYGGSDGLGRVGALALMVLSGGFSVGVVAGLSLILGGIMGGSVKCALSISVYGLCVGCISVFG